MRRVVVTGTNRGLGLEFTRQLLERGDHVVAGCRHPQQAHALSALSTAYPDRLQVQVVDMTDPATIVAFAHAVSTAFDAVDLLVNNAGMLVSGERLGQVSAEALQSSIATNAIGPFLLTQSLLPLLASGERAIVANISSQLGSIARTDSFYTPSYAISKAALNMVSVLLAHGLAGRHVRVIALHPGWVHTDMGGERAPLSPTESVRGMLRVIERLGDLETGNFLDHLGNPLPW